jgi:surfactin synthase thioesterase subunit
VEALRLKNISLEEISALTASTIHLFCFPYAGGLSSLYDRWQPLFPKNIIIHKVEYPGRGMKLHEPTIADVDSLLCHLEKEIVCCDAPFAFFGHSLGAIIAYELAARLAAASHSKKPEVLFLSGCPAPDSIQSFPSMRSMDDQECIREIQALHGTPEELIHTDEFKSFFLPLLRNDFCLLDTYAPSSHRKVDIPLVLFGGTRDPHVNAEYLKKWSEWTANSMKIFEVEGDHFFIHQPETVIEKIGETFAKLSKEYVCRTHS